MLKLHREKTRLYLLVFLTVVLLVIFYLLSRSIPPEKIQPFIEHVGPFGPILLILTLLTTYIFAPMSSTPFLFAGYYAFGTTSIFYTVIAIVISFATNFWIAKQWGRGFVEKLVGHGHMTQIDKLTKSYGLPILFFLRLLQGGVHDIVSYAVGLTPLRFSSYMFVSLIGMTPGVILWYYFAQKVNTPVEFTALSFGMATILSIVFILGAFLIKRFKFK